MNFKTVKEELRGARKTGFTWLAAERRQHFGATPGLTWDVGGSLKREMKSLLAVYLLAETPQWTAAADLLAKSKTVQIAGFQTERGIAMLLANHLQFMRDEIGRAHV